jgi:hypothetical protein
MLQGAILIFAVGGEFFIANRVRRPEARIAAIETGEEAVPA